MSKLTSENIIDVVNELIGPTEPYGASEVDEVRLKNIVKLICLTSWCLDGILDAARYKDSPYFSMREIGERADKAVKDYMQLLIEQE
jgi:hypothetical protein